MEGRRPLSPRILLAHDLDYAGGSVLLEALMRHGYDARRTFGGDHLLEMAEAWQPRGVVIDLALGGGTAFELGAQLRERFGKALRLVGFTAESAPQLESLGRAAGYDELVWEPGDAAGILLALGGPSSALVERSSNALFAWHCHLVESGFHRLRQERIRGDLDPGAVALAGVERIAAQVHAYLGTADLEPDRRRHLAFQLALLEKALETKSR